MSSLALKRRHILGIIVTIVVILIVGVAGFLLGRSKEQSAWVPLAYKEQCEKTGAAWVAANPYPGTQSDQYAYSPDLNTCLVYEQDSDNGVAGDQIIFDIYANKLVASCSQTATSCSNFNRWVQEYFPDRFGRMEY